GWRVPEMHEADVVERSRRLEARNVAAEFRGMLVRPKHNRQRVPANERTNSVFDRPVAGVWLLLLGWNRIEVWRVGRRGHRRALAPRTVQPPLEQVVCALRTFDLDHTFKGINPFLGFDRIAIRLQHIALHVPGEEF